MITPLQNDIASNDMHVRHQHAMLSLLLEFDRVCRACNIKYSLFAGTLLGAVRHGGFIPWDDDADVVMLRADYERFLLEAEKHLDKQNFYLQKEFSAHWPMFYSKLRLNGTTLLEKFYPKDSAMHQGVFIDIFPCDNAYNSKIGRKIQFAASKVVIAKSLYRRGYITDSLVKKVFTQGCRLLPMELMRSISLARSANNSKHVHVFLGGSSRFEKAVFDRAWVNDVADLPFENHMMRCFVQYDRLLRIMYGEYMVLPPENERRVKEHVFLLDLDRSYEHYASARDGVKFEVLTRSIR